MNWAIPSRATIIAVDTAVAAAMWMTNWPTQLDTSTRVISNCAASQVRLPPNVQDAFAYAHTIWISSNANCKKIIIWTYSTWVAASFRNVASVRYCSAAAYRYRGPESVYGAILSA